MLEFKITRQHTQTGAPFYERVMFVNYDAAAKWAGTENQLPNVHQIVMIKQRDISMHIGAIHYIEKRLLNKQNTRIQT